MDIDVEETLGRELHTIASGLRIPALPDLAQEPIPTPRRWPSLLAAAAVVLVVILAAVFAEAFHAGSSPQPMPQPVPAPTGTLPRTAPATPYVLADRLYVDGQQVPGKWWSVDAGGDAWLAWRADDTWWWGRGTEPHRIEARLDVPPAISPNGDYVAMIVTDDNGATLTGFDTASDGEGFGGVTVDAGDPEKGTTVFVRAVTDDGRVVAQGLESGVLWLPLTTGETVDLTETAPGQQVERATAAGLVVGSESPYLAQLSDAGELTRVRDLPVHDDLEVSPGGQWLVIAPGGTLGGEVTSIRSLEAQTVDATEDTTLTAPEGWGFRTLAWAWEDDEHLVSPVVTDDGQTQRITRCSVLLARCVLVDAG
ncbi:hypothetical protein ABLE68_01525 [Nocardioides sp. CN2-186]|uniref:hypothetical protein n=1 Tax=Nocardioides tweenelious TaxID=3156607 RepID=UPI0032B5C8C3